MAIVHVPGLGVLPPHPPLLPPAPLLTPSHPNINAFIHWYEATSGAVAPAWLCSTSTAEWVKLYGCGAVDSQGWHSSLAASEIILQRCNCIEQCEMLHRSQPAHQMNRLSEKSLIVSSGYGCTHDLRSCIPHAWLTLQSEGPREASSASSSATCCMAAAILTMMQ